MRGRARLGRWLPLIVALALGPSGWGGPPKAREVPPLPPLNRAVVEFARERVGEQVGNGECTTLAVEALRAAGARLSPLRGRDADYVWGEPVGSFREALPGDLVQFRDAVFEGRRYVARQRWVNWRETYPHHTAVVAEVRERGKVVVLLHQNTGKAGADEATRRKVKATTLRPDSLVAGGTVWVYRPVAAGTRLRRSGEPARPATEPAAEPPAVGGREAEGGEAEVIPQVGRE